MLHIHVHWHSVSCIISYRIVSHLISSHHFASNYAYVLATVLLDANEKRPTKPHKKIAAEQNERKMPHFIILFQQTNHAIHLN